MQIYLVGGAVRDELLGLPIHDRDWVVVGASSEQLLEEGYTQVGKDFPVFLHPQTREEYALARAERKTGPGYHGFEFDTSSDITLEDDLIRRDLTINAMAKDQHNGLIDPFGGADDIKAGLLRHVSKAFREDPVRILRVARFAARFADRGFTIAEETLQLMREMVKAGEVDHLVAERVWQEMSRALCEPRPSIFFQSLRACGALSKILPEVDRLFGIPQPAQHHPEIDTGDHVMRVLDQARLLSDAPEVMFAALMHDLGKGLTPEDEWPSHRGHEESGLDPVKTVCERLRVPGRYQKLALRVCEHHLRCHRVEEMRASSILKLIQSVDGLRNETRFEQFLLACEADARGRLGLETRHYPQAGFLRQARKAAMSISITKFVEQGLAGAKMGQVIHQERIKAIKQMMRTKKL